MKITCPFCEKEFNFKDSDELDNHFYHEHGWEGGLTSEYAYLIFKIHEKIEFFQNDVNEHPNHGSKYLPITIIKQLKSLLEDEK